MKKLTSRGVCGKRGKEDLFNKLLCNHGKIIRENKIKATIGKWSNNKKLGPCGMIVFCLLLLSIAKIIMYK